MIVKLWKRFSKEFGQLLCLGLSYLLCRFVFFGVIHKMKDWPDLLACFGLLILLISYALRLRWTARFATFGYMIGFVVGAVFQTDGIDPGGGAANSLWLLWTSMYLLCMMTGLITDGVIKRRCSKKGESKI